MKMNIIFIAISLLPPSPSVSTSYLTSFFGPLLLYIFPFSFSLSFSLFHLYICNVLRLPPTSKIIVTWTVYMPSQPCLISSDQTATPYHLFLSLATIQLTQISGWTVSSFTPCNWEKMRDKEDHNLLFDFLFPFNFILLSTKLYLICIRTFDRVEVWL